MTTVAAALLESIDQQLPGIERCVGKLGDTLLWRRVLPAMNSVGNLCLHLCGNLNHYVGACIGSSGYERDRPGEFNATDGHGAEGLLLRLRDARDTVAAVVEGLNDEDLPRCVDSDHPENATVLTLLVQVSTHFAYHTGQILTLTKVLTENDERLLEWGH